MHRSTDLDEDEEFDTEADGAKVLIKLATLEATPLNPKLIISLPPGAAQCKVHQ